MKILSAKQIRQVDEYTILHEPILSVDLMERAANECFRWLAKNCDPGNPFKIFCGTGNNGGDGLAIARMLLDNKHHVEVFIIGDKKKSSGDFKKNLERLSSIKKNSISGISSQVKFPSLGKNDIVIDSLFGTGLSRPVDKLRGSLIDHINNSEAKVVSIDMPSGLFADQSSISLGNKIIQADYTLTFQFIKRAFLFAENVEYTGHVVVLPIGLNEKFISTLESDFSIVEEKHIRLIIKKRKTFSHKGNYGHALIAAGSFGKMGAAVLAARACVRTGAGLTTVAVPKCGYEIIQTAVPEAMCNAEQDKYMLTQPLGIKNFTATGIGPGIGTHKSTVSFLKEILKKSRKPLVLDADALNILSKNKSLLKHIPAGSILTPHPKEFERMCGKSSSNFERNEMQIAISKKYKVIIVLKGKYTCTSTPDGKCFFNPTGNPGMAKGGSGDVLTGMLTALLAQDYRPEEAAIAGVYLHGLAGDLAASEKGENTMTASDIIDKIGNCFIT